MLSRYWSIPIATTQTCGGFDSVCGAGCCRGAGPVGAGSTALGLVAGVGPGLNEFRPATIAIPATLSTAMEITKAAGGRTRRRFHFGPIDFV